MAPKGLKIRPPFLLLLLFLSLFSTPQRTEALVGIGQWRVIASLSHSLMNRVANVRAERGDLEGANRARKIASKMEGGLGLGFGFWSVGWDYAKNYAWRSRDVESSNEILRAVSDANELLGLLKELGGVESEKGRAKWVYQNYQRVLDASKSILRRLLVVFARSVSFAYAKEPFIDWYLWKTASFWKFPVMFFSWKRNWWLVCRKDWFFFSEQCFCDLGVVAEMIEVEDPQTQMISTEIWIVQNNSPMVIW